MKREIQYLVLCILFVSVIKLEASRIISVNYNETQGRCPMLESDFAGANAAVRTNNWNDVNNDEEIVVDPRYCDGTLVGGNFSVNLNLTSTALPVSGYKNDAQMYAGLVDMKNSSVDTVILENIPFKVYDLYVYAKGPKSNRGGALSISAADSLTYYVRGGSVPADDGSGYTRITTTDYDSDNVSAVKSGNYVLWEKLTDKDLTITARTLYMGDSTYYRLHVCGFQIVEVPSSGTVILVK